MFCGPAWKANLPRLRWKELYVVGSFIWYMLSMYFSVLHFPSLHDGVMKPTWQNCGLIRPVWCLVVAVYNHSCSRHDSGQLCFCLTT